MRHTGLIRARRLVPGIAAVALLMSATVPAAPAQDRRATIANFRYDSAIPTLTQVVGHDHGEEVTSPEEIATYLRALAAAAPTRTRLVEYGRTYEGRPLLLLAIAAPARVAALDAIKQDLRRLADPRASGTDTEALIARTPVVVALLHSVHGNEISPAGAALLEAWHLLAAENDPRTTAILNDAIVLIDPLQNPDGRGRFVQSTRAGRASRPDAFALSAEHDEPWPGGRANHYLFDLNRDWFAQTQPESRGRVAAMLEWMPHVVVDLHEMGGESTFYFPPSAPPGNRHTTPSQYAALEMFGRSLAGAFDQRGFPYFTGEVFDAFYPGYGVSWPIAQGAIGMTFEKSSARGLVFRRDDGTLLTYMDGIVEHFTAAMTTAHTAAMNRERLLREFVAFRRSAIEEGERSSVVRQYVLLANGDPGRARHLAALLRRNGIEVQQTTAATTLQGRTIPAGTLVVLHGQPSGRLVRNLLDERTDMPEDFVKAQAERRVRRQPDQIYDVTAWSLPLLYDIETLRLAQPLAVGTAPWTPAAPAAAAAVPPARVAWVLPWNASTASTVAAALTQDVNVSVAGAAFTIGGRTWPVGSAVVRVAGNPADTATRLGAIIATTGAEIVALDSAFTEQGISLGSNQVRALKAPRVLLAWDAPTQSLSAGWARYVLERRFGVVPSAVRVGTLPRVDLAEFDVVILPSGSYASAIGSETVRRLKDWVSAGGTLVTIGEATRWALGDAVGLLGTSAEWKDGTPIKEGPAPTRPAAPTQPIDLAKAIEPARELPTLVPGAIANTVVDTEHWLASGLDTSVPVSVQGQRVFSPLTLDKGRNVLVFAPKDTLVASGIFWEESQRLLPGKPYLMHQPTGRGHVVAFSDDPNNRAFAEATQLLFINAVLMGPAM